MKAPDFLYRRPDTPRRGAGAARRQCRRGAGAGRRPKPDADAQHAAVVARHAGRHQPDREPAGHRASAATRFTSARWCGIARWLESDLIASRRAAGGVGHDPCRAYGGAQSRHHLWQSGACRSVGGDAGGRRPAERDDSSAAARPERAMWRPAISFRACTRPIARDDEMITGVSFPCAADERAFSTFRNSADGTVTSPSSASRVKGRSRNGTDRGRRGGDLRLGTDAASVDRHGVDEHRPRYAGRDVARDGARHRSRDGPDRQSSGPAGDQAASGRRIAAAAPSPNSGRPPMSDDPVERTTSRSSSTAKPSTRTRRRAHASRAISSATRWAGPARISAANTASAARAT